MHDPQIARLLTILNSANLATTNNALYQVLRGLIERAGIDDGGLAVNEANAAAFSLPPYIVYENAANNFTQQNSFAGFPIDLQSGQIKFPATQNASSDANTLDDYEEGTWTPILGADITYSSQIYTNQVGSYVKIGRQISCGFSLSISNAGFLNGNLFIAGLPFTIATGGNYQHGSGAGYFGNVAAGITAMGIYTVPSTNYVYLTACKASLQINIVNADITPNFVILGEVNYRTVS